jgi:hypothetical protein
MITRLGPARTTPSRQFVKGRFAMIAGRPVTRRTVLAALPVAGVVVAHSSCVASDAEAAVPRRHKASPELQSLIEAHKVAYRHFANTVVDRRTYQAADLVEQRALLAIEARGELDLPEHMQAILRSIRSE